MLTKKQAVFDKKRGRAAADEREEMGREMARLAERKAAAEGEYDQMAAKLWDEYQLTLSQAEELCVEFENVNVLQAQVADLRGKIRALGNVNVSAIEEYQEVKTRYDTLRAQVEDVEGSKNELSRMITSLSGQMKDIFTDSFRAINENFGRVFTELFGGGEASLVLEDETDVLGCGIGGVAGMLYALYYGSLSASMGGMATMKAFSSSVLGGLVDIQASAIGGLLIGILENYGIALFSSSLRDMIAFVFLIIVLIFFPKGLRIKIGRKAK